MVNKFIAENINYQLSSSFSIKDVSMAFPEQSITGIIGPNGSGKSTLLKVLTNLTRPDHGVVTIDGRKVAEMSPKILARKITMLSQTQSHGLDLTVRELISHGRFPYRKWYERLTGEDDEKIDWAISMTNLEHLQDQSIMSLSGGERQRAWIAMAIVQSPEILLLDEPTTYLDISHQLEVMEMVRYLNSELKMTIVMVLHDINQAAKYSDYLTVVKDGAIVKNGRPKEIMTEALFRDVFSIHVKINEEAGEFSFTPLGLVKNNYIK